MLTLHRSDRGVHRRAENPRPLHSRSSWRRRSSSQPLSPEARLIAGVLRDALMLDGRTFDPILRDHGNPWRTLTGQCLEPDEIARLVLDPEQVVGIRHRHRMRLLFVDIDAHGDTPSPYWHADGQSAELQRLEAAAADLGIGHILVRSSNSGGLHALLVLPVAVPRQVAHEFGRRLIEQAGMTLGGGRCELFPSSTAYTPGDDAKAWARSHGVRLPGQAGSAIWTGHGWADDPMLPWEELAALLQDTTTTEAFEALLAEAEAAVKAQRVLRPTIALPRRSTGTIRHRVRWTGPGQSNRLLGELANAAYLQTAHRTPEALGAEIARLARSAPGFDEYASDGTKAALDAWAVRWARSCISRPPTASKGSQAASGGDKHWNTRQHQKVVCRVMQAAHRAAREHGAAALKWSERRLADFAKVSRRAVRKIKAVWVGALQCALPKRVGTHPLPTGGTTSALDQTFSTGSNDFDLISPRLRPFAAASGAQKVVQLPPPTAPPPRLRAADPASARRQQEYAELMAWIGAAG